MASLALLAQAASNETLNESTGLGTKFGIVFLLIVGSFLAGYFLSRWLRMADYGWKIGLVLFALLAGGTICVMGWPPKLGIDLTSLAGQAGHA